MSNALIKYDSIAQLITTKDWMKKNYDNNQSAKIFFPAQFPSKS